MLKLRFSLATLMASVMTAGPLLAMNIIATHYVGRRYVGRRLSMPFEDMACFRRGFPFTFDGSCRWERAPGILILDVVWCTTAVLFVAWLTERLQERFAKNRNPAMAPAINSSCILFRWFRISCIGSFLAFVAALLFSTRL